MNAKKKHSFWDSNISFYAVNTILLVFASLIVLIPILNVIASSFSSPSAVIRGQVGILPVGFNLNAYKAIFASSMLMRGTLNSFIYTILGTAINILMTILAAYPLSVKDFVGKKVITFAFMLTMVFTAPLIPTYLVIRDLKLIDSMWALILPGAISVYNMIICRTYFVNSIPGEMIEAAEIDGATDIGILLSIILPLSKSIIAVLVLYYAVAHWNSYFNAFIYLNSAEKFPLQVVLRNIISATAALEEVSDVSVEQSERAAVYQTIKYAVIVYGCIPVMILYPFVQRHFVKGVMIGSVKG